MNLSARQFDPLLHLEARRSQVATVRTVTDARTLELDRFERRATYKPHK